MKPSWFLILIVSLSLSFWVGPTLAQKPKKGTQGKPVSAKQDPNKDKVEDEAADEAAGDEPADEAAGDEPADEAAENPEESDEGADAEPPALTPEQEAEMLKDASYVIGMNLANILAEQGLSDAQLDLDSIRDGIADRRAENPPRIDQKKIKSTMGQFQAYMRALPAKIAAAFKEIGEKNKKDGAKFLADNKKKEGVKTTKSGLQYKVLTKGKGKGKSPTKADSVLTSYRGALIDGREFDSSPEARFNMTEIIPGLREALQLMKVGDKWQLFIPTQLAYKQERRGKLITPHSTLIFEVELLGIESGEEEVVENEPAADEAPADEKEE